MFYSSFFLCFFRQLGSLVWYGHWSQCNTPTGPWQIFWWCVMFPFETLLPHLGHWSLWCFLLWELNFLLLSNSFPHSAQNNDIAAWMVSMCLLRLAFDFRIVGQSSHIKGPSPHSELLICICFDSSLLFWSSDSYSSSIFTSMTNSSLILCISLLSPAPSASSLFLLPPVGLIVWVELKSENKHQSLLPSLDILK